MTKRRELLRMIALSGAGALVLWPRRQAAHAAVSFRISHSNAEWRAILSPTAYYVLREQGTEVPFSSRLDMESRQGIYHCAGCALPVFSSTTKYDSHTGWPSFWKPLQYAVAEDRDTSFRMAGTEIHCTQCGGHLGAVFADGPPPTGLRYCVNGAALTFAPA